MSIPQFIRVIYLVGSLTKIDSDHLKTSFEHLINKSLNMMNGISLI